MAVDVKEALKNTSQADLQGGYVNQAADRSIDLAPSVLPPYIYYETHI